MFFVYQADREAGEQDEGGLVNWMKNYRGYQSEMAAHYFIT